ncbi:uncharacterized protein LOC110018614 [Phalaenopsis equestris]|uniref:uncharacterized protein LOC110018614 n=1 Tax=Phalaenopsis equestris TaxID=78828 RepID=UPI0009E43BAD|nr:uncharacterized protein LOC110018614 [Phalaenopsis equestris]
MAALRVFSRIPKAYAQLLPVRASLLPKLLCGCSDFGQPASSLSKWLPNNMNLLRHPYHREVAFQRFGFSSSAFSQATEKVSQSGDRDNSSSKISDPAQETSEVEMAGKSTEANGDTPAPEQSNGAGFSSNYEHSESQSSKKRRGRATKRTEFSESDTEPELSIEELIKLVAERDDSLKIKQKEIEKMQEKVLRTYADMENVLERTKREVENSKKYGIQNFAKGLLDVADNLGRASSAVKENFSKIDQTSDNEGVTLLKSLLEGVEMTEKQLAEVFRKFGIQKYDPLNENFDPHQHNAVFELPDASKPLGVVVVVLKPGYMIHDRVLRPAEVGVSKAPPDES